MTNMKALRRVKEQQHSRHGGNGAPSPTHADRDEAQGRPQLVSVPKEDGTVPRGAAREGEIIPPAAQMREMIAGSGLLDVRTRGTLQIDMAEADLEARLGDVLRKYSDVAKEQSLSDILAIRKNVGVIRDKYIDIALKLYAIQQATPEVYKAITRDPSLIDLTSDSDISKLRTVGEAIRTKKVQIEWLPKSKEAAYEVAKLDYGVIQEGLRSGQIGPNAKVTAVKAWVKTKTSRPLLENPDTVDSIDEKIGILLRRKEEIEEEAARRIGVIMLEIRDLRQKKQVLLSQEDADQ